MWIVPSSVPNHMVACPTIRSFIRLLFFARKLFWKIETNQHIIYKISRNKSMQNYAFSTKKFSFAKLLFKVFFTISFFQSAVGSMAFLVMGCRSGSETIVLPDPKLYFFRIQNYISSGSKTIFLPDPKLNFFQIRSYFFRIRRYFFRIRNYISGSWSFLFNDKIVIFW